MSACLRVENLVKTYAGTRKTPPVEAVRGISFAVLGWAGVRISQMAPPVP